MRACMCVCVYVLAYERVCVCVHPPTSLCLRTIKAKQAHPEQLSTHTCKHPVPTLLSSGNRAANAASASVRSPLIKVSSSAVSPCRSCRDEGKKQQGGRVDASAPASTILQHSSRLNQPSSPNKTASQSMLRCALLCCAVLCCAVLCCAVQCCAGLCCAGLCCAWLGCAWLGCGAHLQPRLQRGNLVLQPCQPLGDVCHLLHALLVLAAVAALEGPPARQLLPAVPGRHVGPQAHNLSICAG